MDGIAEILIAAFLLIVLCPLLYYLFVYLGQKQEKKEYEELLLRADMNKVDHMEGYEFEDFCAAVLKKNGYKVEQTKYSRDFGADLILHTSDKKIVVQTKRYSNKVSLSAVQEIATARRYYGANQAWVITNNFFTSTAKTLAESNGVVLVDREKLAKLICSAKDKEKQ